MRIDELNDAEELALLGLMREIVQADGEYTPGERAAVDALRTELGVARFDKAILRAMDAFDSRAELKEHAKTITRPEARELIFETLKKVAAADGVGQTEEKPLAWLASWWGLGG
jgi:uncharacterized tellurite resistance protein B-like protein